ncbi:recombinase family protein [Bacillus haynesii]|uniref:recombinase family protein n=1 Tax=Bacillus haynesii TaxID=1925021 RepID=UPI0022817750|nr:recombinase family protein [Bacillus haynesii]MCY8241406.1 recombinase family protein [Bacillus haynesii]
MFNLDLKERIKRVAIYLRKSRDNEGEESDETLAKHRNRLLDIAKKNNWEYEIFQEVESSMDSNRPEYQKMIHQLKESFFDAVLSVNLARVTRDDAETPRFMRLLREEDILFVTDSERIFDLEIQEDWQALKFTGFVNNWEYENIRAQLRKGKIDSAKMGRWSNGSPPFGYIYNRLERQIEIDKEKAEGVKLAFQMVIDGIGVDIIAIHLNQLGFRTNRGNLFQGNSIQRMIRSEIYKGWIISNRLKGRNTYEGKIRPKEQWIIIKDAVKPCIIDETTWNLANEKLDQRKRLSPRAKQRRHGLSSIIKCALCGRTHSVTIRKDRNNRKEIKPCNKKNQLGERCYNRGINYNTMMELIIDSIGTKRKQIITELENLKEERPAIDTKSKKINIIEERIKKVKRTLEILQIQLEEELIDLENFKERKKKRTIELDNLQKELKKLQDTTAQDEIESKETLIKRLDFFLNNWQQLEDFKLNESLMSIISKVIWHYPKGSKEAPKLTIEWLE